MASESDGVTVPRWALAALVGVALVALLGVAFLLGRESARPSAAPVSAPVAAVPSEAPRELEVAPVPPRPVPVEAAPMVPVRAAPASPTPERTVLVREAPPVPVAPAPAPAVDPAERDRVARYFRSLESAVGMAAAWQNPDVVANSVLSQGAQGDSSGFDMVLQANQQALARVRAVTPPEPCRRHHQLTVQLMADGIRMLQRLREATLSGDTGPLMALAAEGQQLQGQIQELDLMGQRLKAQYGL